MMHVLASLEQVLQDDQIAAPLAAILVLTQILEHSQAGTMAELVQELRDGAEALTKHSATPISLNAGSQLFISFVTLFPHESASFKELKSKLITQGKQYVQQALTYRTRIAELAFDFIKDDSVILTHSYSRVVMQTLLLAHRRKRISVFVTEAKPRGLGLKTAELLTTAGIPCTVILDSAVAYAMHKVDFVLVGSEAVVESGGLINAVGSYQIAIIAKAANKPFYALAESYKFHRLFPLSQYDLPTHNPNLLAPSRPPSSSAAGSVRSPTTASDPALPFKITQEQIAQNNPDVDYTRPDLISLVFSDVGSLTPEGVSQYLVGMFAG